MIKRGDVKIKKQSSDHYKTNYNMHIKTTVGGLSKNKVDFIIIIAIDKAVAPNNGSSI